MAAKRFLNESGLDPDRQNEKRMRTRPSFASVIGEVVMVNSLQNFCSALEPLLRRVVNEEVDRGLRRCTRSFTRSSSFRIQALEPSNLQLVFSNEPSLPTIFTGSKITDAGNNPLQILVVDTSNGNQMVQSTLSHPIKVEIVVLDGDFPKGDGENWSSEEFNNKIVKERTGKRPLLAGESVVTLREGSAAIGDIEFTDNSSWIRSRKFRIGAKVVQGTCQGIRIREAMTQAFVVKDHRGELYKKHHPPALEDEVWRLEKIGKEGAFHKKLAQEEINTVQDFLKMSVVYPDRLRKILGSGMSDKMWDVTLRHARTCVLGNKLKLYMSGGPQHIIFLNPICQVVRAMINGQVYSSRDLSCINRDHIETFVREAFINWKSLEEVDGLLNETALLTQGDPVQQYSNHHHHHHHQHQHGSVADVSMEVAYLPSSEHVGNSDWINPTYLSIPAVENNILHNFSESSDDDLTPSRPFINGGPP